jgi:hypothetical protein
MLNDDGRTGRRGETVLRAATTSEVPAVLAFWQAAAEDRKRPVDTSDALTALLRRDPEALILAADGDQIVGTIIAGWTAGGATSTGSPCHRPGDGRVWVAGW